MEFFFHSCMFSYALNEQERNEPLIKCLARSVQNFNLFEFFFCYKKMKKKNSPSPLLEKISFLFFIKSRLRYQIKCRILLFGKKIFKVFFWPFSFKWPNCVLGTQKFWNFFQKPHLCIDRTITILNVWLTI